MTITGNTHVGADAVRSYFHAGPDGHLDADRLDAALKNLYATGLFQGVKISRDGDRIRVKVVENPTIERVAVAISGRLSLDSSRRWDDVHSPDDYEAVIAPVYAWAHAAAQSGRSSATVEGGRTVGAWQALRGNGRGTRALRRRVLPMAFPWVVRAANAAGLGPLRVVNAVQDGVPVAAVEGREERAGACVLVQRVAQIVGETNPAVMEFIGIQNRYAESGGPDELLDKYGLRAKEVAAAARKAISRKK